MLMNYQVMDSRYEAACEILSKKWTLQIVRILMGGRKRFSEFKHQLPTVSDRLLSERLQELEEKRVIYRHVHNTKPVLIEYELSPRGIALEPIVESIQNWGDIWIE